MKKNIIVCALLILAATFVLPGQNVNKAKANIQKMIGEWSYTSKNPLDGSPIAGEVTVVKEGDEVYMYLGGFDENPVKTSAITPGAKGLCTTDFYMEQYTYVVPLDLLLIDEDTIKVTIDTGGYFVEFNLLRKK